MSMLRRFSSTFKKSKDSNGDGEPRTRNRDSSKRFSMPAPTRKSVATDDGHQVKRAEVVAVFDKYAQAIHAAREPLPTQTEDPSVKHEQSGLVDDIKALGFRDLKTVKELIESKASGELVDDKTMLMERIIQVGSDEMYEKDLSNEHYSWFPVCLATRRTVPSSPIHS